MRILITVITINLLMLFAAHTAQAGSLGEETKKMVEKGYEISSTGVMNTERGFAGTYFVILVNLESKEHPLVICKERYDAKKAGCYDL